MSALAPVLDQPAAPEAIAAAVAHAERRLWLLDMILAFGMALVRALKPGGAAGVLLIFARVKALAAVSRAVRLAVTVEAETDRRLRCLEAGILPAPKPAARPRAPSARSIPILKAHEAGGRDSDAGFGARLEALEALIDQGAHADWSAQEWVQRLARVMNIKPAWSRWLGDDWLEENLNARRMPNLPPCNGGSTAKPGGGLPPPPLRGPPPPLRGGGSGPPRPAALALMASASPAALLHAPPPVRRLTLADLWPEVEAVRRPRLVRG